MPHSEDQRMRKLTEGREGGREGMGGREGEEVRERRKTAEMREKED